MFSFLSADKTTSSDDSPAEWKQLVISQSNILREQALKSHSTDVEIERMEAEIHKWRSKTHGKNYVQVGSNGVHDKLIDSHTLANNWQIEICCYRYKNKHLPAKVCMLVYIL